MNRKKQDLIPDDFDESCLMNLGEEPEEDLEFWVRKSFISGDDN